MRFADRRAAGRQLADQLAPLIREHQPEGSDPLVLALPRGGVPVAAATAARLGVPLDVYPAHKIGAPGFPEVAVGAVAGTDDPVFDPYALRALGLTEAGLAADVDREKAELRRREELYRGGRPPPDPAGRTVVVVDDGLATGMTATAAVRSLRGRGAAAIVLAVPVAAPDAAEALRAEADEVLCLSEPPGFHAVGSWYEDFAQVTDAEVVRLLRPGGAAGT